MNETTRFCDAMTRTDGHPCRRPVAPGFKRCNLHGGHSPQARQAAAETLARAALPAAQVPLEVVSRWLDVRCEVCGCPTGDPMPALNAARMVLDRTGFHPSVTVQHEPAEVADWSRYLTDEEAEAMGEMIEAAKTRMRAGVLPDAPADPLLLESAMVDGVVVPDVVSDAAADAAHDDEVEI